MLVFPSAVDAWFGSSTKLSPSGNVTMSRRYRLYDVNPSSGGLKMVMPDARGFAPGTEFHAHQARTGGPLWVVANRSGTNTIGVYANDGTTLIATVGTASAVWFWCVDNSTANGTWFTDSTSTVSRSGSLSSARLPYTIAVGTRARTLDCAAFLLSDLGWDGTTPVALTLVCETGIVWGAENENSVGVDTGTLPAGSTCLIINRGLISGHGGDGGRGGVPATATAPQAGGTGSAAIISRLNVSIVNHGTIQGGGGGGGGGGYVSGSTDPLANGGGGGGGAGWGPSSGANARPGAGGGSSGYETIPGVGGYGAPGAGSGGGGGAPGASGTAGQTIGGVSGGAGGAAGPYLSRLSTTTATWIVTGTRHGAEVTF